MTDAWDIPSSAVSGVYIANIVQGSVSNPSQIFQIPFVVKNPNSDSDIVFQTSDETWEAYNGWGGANLYGGNGPAPVSDGQTGLGAAYAVSYNRPLTTYDSSGAESGAQDSVFGDPKFLCQRTDQRPTYGAGEFDQRRQWRLYIL